MTIVELDASKWSTLEDFYEGLLAAVGAPDWHGRNPNALVDSLVYGSINDLEPPYTIRMHRLAQAPQAVAEHVRMIVGYLIDARRDYHASHHEDCGAFFEIV